MVNVFLLRIYPPPLVVLWRTNSDSYWCTKNAVFLVVGGVVVFTLTLRRGSSPWSHFSAGTLGRPEQPFTKIEKFGYLIRRSLAVVLLFGRLRHDIYVCNIILFHTWYTLSCVLDEKLRLSRQWDSYLLSSSPIIAKLWKYWKRMLSDKNDRVAHFFARTPCCLYRVYRLIYCTRYILEVYTTAESSSLLGSQEQLD